MSELLEWKEVESFDTPHQGAVLAGEPEESSSHAAEDVVHVYIKLEEESSAKEVIQKISAEVLEGEYPDIQYSTLEENLITVNIPYGQIAAIKEIAGVVSVELVGKAVPAQAEELKEVQETESAGEESQEEGYTDRQENTGMIQIPNACSGEETVSGAESGETEASMDGQEKAGMIQLNTTAQKETQTEGRSLGIMSVLILLVVVIAGLIARKKRN